MLCAQFQDRLKLDIKRQQRAKRFALQNVGQEGVTSGCMLPQAGANPVRAALTIWLVFSKQRKEKLLLVRGFRRITNIGRTVWIYVFSVVNWFLTNQTISRYLNNSVSQQPWTWKSKWMSHASQWKNHPFASKRLMLETAKDLTPTERLWGTEYS